MLLSLLLAPLLGYAPQSGWFPTQPPPVVTSARFLPWCEAYVQASIDSVPLERAQTYYFSDQGNDTTGNGSLTNPFKSIAKANQVITASGGNVRIRFAKGGVWRGETNLVVTKPDVTIDSYLPSDRGPSSPKPLFTRFQIVEDWSDWSFVAPGVYATQVEPPVAWVKLQGDNDSVFHKMSNLDDVKLFPGSWVQIGSQLYVHNLGSQTLTTGARRIEYVVKNSFDGIKCLDVGNVRVQGIHVEGYGAGAKGDYSYSGYGVALDQSGPRRAVVVDCETYYNGRHSITRTSLVPGGSLVVVNCRAGWLVNDGIQVISYSAGGAQELVAAYNEFLGGELPHGPKPYPYAGSGEAVYAHTEDDDTTKHAFFLSYKNEYRKGQHQNDLVAWAPSAPGFQRLEDCRTFVVGERYETRNRTPLDSTSPSSNGGNGASFRQLGGPNTMYVNCTVNPRVLWSGSGDVSILQLARGTWINSTVIADFSDSFPDPENYVRALASTGDDMSLYTASFLGCRITFVGNGSGLYGFSGAMLHPYGANRNSLAAKWQGLMRGSIVESQGIGSGQFLVGFGNDGASMASNAYYGVSDETGAWGTDLDAARISGTHAPGRRPIGDPARVQGGIWLMGHRLEYDAEGRARDANTAVGPLESLRPSRMSPLSGTASIAGK